MREGPTDRRDLPQVVTLFNVYKDMDTGALEYFRTILDGVRVGRVKTSLAAAIRGETKRTHIIALIDPRATKGYDLNEVTGKAITPGKTYKSWRDWIWLSAQDKGFYWTLNAGDWLAAHEGEKRTIAPEFKPLQAATEQEFKLRHGVKTITELAPTIDEDGSIHHWTVGLD